jgi:hypothetical protein
MNSKFALITFLDSGAGGPVDPGYGVPGPGQPPVGIWPSPGHPAHPIAPGGVPGVPTHPIYQPPYPSTGPGFPTHPIAPGGQPPYPSHQPVFPPVTPDNTLPSVPGEPPPTVSLPIVLPPTNKPVEPDALFELKWSPMYGWVLVPIKDDDEAQPKKK